jgi:hypothetical protein
MSKFAFFKITSNCFFNRKNYNLNSSKKIPKHLNNFKFQKCSKILNKQLSRQQNKLRMIFNKSIINFKLRVEER